MVSQAFRSLVLSSLEDFSVRPSVVICLREAVYKGAGEVGRGENKEDSPTSKLLHVFTLVCKAGEGLVWWSRQERQSNSGFGHHQSVFPCGKTLVHTAGVGRRSPCAAFQGLQSFRGLPSTCYTPGSGWLLYPAQDPLKQQESGAVDVWGGKRALWWPHVLDMGPLPVLDWGRSPACALTRGC